MTKLSLAEMQAKLDIEAHNSNLGNIAHALRYLDEGMRLSKKAYEDYLADAAKLKAELIQLSERDQNDLTYDDIHKPYEKARNLGIDYSPKGRAY